MASIRRMALAALAVVSAVAQKEGGQFFSFGTNAPSGALQLGGAGSAPEIRVSADDHAGVKRAANNLATDFGRVLGGANAAVVSTSTPGSFTGSRPVIIVGTVKTALINSLVSSKAIDVSEIEGKWEAYVSTPLVDSSSGKVTALVIAGSDLRGTIYGIYDVSEQIGVSPWYWWADVVPQRRTAIFAPTERRVVGPPSVKFRGIFLNDEAPALTNWAAGNYPRSQYGNPFNSDFYARVFDLILRLKGNYLWPAMWNSMFYLDDTRSGPLANDHGIFMGTSHHEPMARADKEQGRFCQGPWDWSRNRANVQRFMAEGVSRSKNWFTIYTVGMRGSGDAASATLTSRQLEEIIEWQHSTLRTTFGVNMSEIPLAWMMYKEVPGYWQNGMRISDDVTLVWTDDNRGNIRRIPTAKENQRRGGSGMYYHFDYVGAPRNYKWINTIQLQKTWEQMHLAYERGVRQMWIVNVGDLKPMEIPISHFMAMAYDMNKFSTPESTGTWLREWAARQFGNAVADVTASIMTKYGTLCARRKYEDLSITPFAFSATEYDEAELNYAAWVDLLNVTQAAYNTLPADVQPSYFEMVLHPVMAGKTVFEIYTNAALANRYAGETRLTANELAQGARDAFSRDQQITRQYHTLLGGKWNHMMDQTHIGYNNWQEPAQNSLPTLRTVSANAARSGKQFGIGVQSPGRPGVSAAADAATVTLAPIDQFTPERRYFDVFLRTTGSLSFTVSTDAAFVSLSSTGGNLASTGGPAQQRIYVSIPDWAAVPAGTTSVSIVVRAGSASTTVNVPLVIRPALPADFKKGHVESGGVVSIEAPHWTTASAGNPSYVAIPDLGRTLGSVKLWPVTAPSQSPASGPFLSYDFYTFTAPTGSNVRVTVYLSASENADVEHPNRFALSIDNGTTVTVQPVPLASNAGNEPPGWDAAVTSNAWVRDVTVSPGGGALRPGKHTLRVWLLEPTMVLAKLVIDLGGRRPSELGPPESVWLSGV